MERAFHSQLDNELLDYIIDKNIPVDIRLANNEILKGVNFIAEDDFFYMIIDNNDNDFKNRIINKGNISEFLLSINFNKHLDKYFENNEKNKRSNCYNNRLFTNFIGYAHKNNIPVVVRTRHDELVGVFLRGSSRFNILIEDPQETDGYINRYVHKSTIVDICLGFDYAKTL